MSNDLTTASLQLIESRSPTGYGYWLGQPDRTTPRQIGLQEHADIVYTLYLLGRLDLLNVQAAHSFVAMLASMPLHGRSPDSNEHGTKTISAHLTAYALGAVRLLVSAGIVGESSALLERWNIEKLVDERMLPIWPRQWSHHIWRVSHWIGGIPSILLQLARYGHPQINEDFVQSVLSACEQHIINPQNGLLRPYRSEMLQQLFRSAYRLRHDPDLGDTGGVVHLLWVYHALGRPYMGSKALAGKSSLQMQRSPFIEAMPYCLDFDIVQLARTAEREGSVSVEMIVRSQQFYDDIISFLTASIPKSYTLHKLPGALATMHECALICQWQKLPELNIKATDIIRDAYWI